MLGVSDGSSQGESARLLLQREAEQCHGKDTFFLSCDSLALSKPLTVLIHWVWEQNEVQGPLLSCLSAASPAQRLGGEERQGPVGLCGSGGSECSAGVSEGLASRSGGALGRGRRAGLLAAGEGVVGAHQPPSVAVLDVEKGELHSSS